MILPAASTVAAAAVFTYYTGRTLSCNIIITGVELGVEIKGDRRDATFTFRVSGAVTPA